MATNTATISSLRKFGSYATVQISPNPLHLLILWVYCFVLLNNFYKDSKSYFNTQNSKTQALHKFAVIFFSFIFTRLASAVAV